MSTTREVFPALSVKKQEIEKLYTAFDVIRLVQKVVSDEICMLDSDSEVRAALEAERSIIAEVVKGD